MSFLILIQHFWNIHIDTKISRCQAKSNKKLFRSFWSMIARHLSLERPVAVSKRPTSNTSSTWRNGFGRDGSISSFWANHKIHPKHPNGKSHLRFANLQLSPSIQPHPSEVFSRFFHPSLQVLSSEPPCRTAVGHHGTAATKGQFYPQKIQKSAHKLVGEPNPFFAAHFHTVASVLDFLDSEDLPRLKVNEVIVNNNCIHSIHVFHRSKASTKLQGKIALGGFPELPIEAIDSVYLVDKIHAPPPQFFAAKALFHTLLELLQHIEVPSIHISLFFVKNGRHPKFPCWAPHPSHQSHQSQLFRSCASSRTANLVKPAEKRSSARSSCGASGLDAYLGGYLRYLEQWVLLIFRDGNVKPTRLQL